jgi:hypothetical protein
VKRAALLAVLALAGCQPEPATSVRKEHMNIAVDTEGRIKLNGKPVTDEELAKYLTNQIGKITLVPDADREGTVTIDGKTMTAEELADYLRGSQER